MRYPQAAFEPIVSHVVHQAYKGNWVPVNSLVTLFNEHGIEIDETFIKGTPPALKTVIQPIYQENRTFIKRFVATGCPLHKIPQPILFELVPNLFEFQDIMADFSNILDSCNKCVEHDMAGLNNHCETTVIHDVISAISRTTFVNVTQALQSLDKTTLHNFAVRLLSKISWVLLSGTLHEIQRVGAFVLNMFETIISKKPSESDVSGALTWIDHCLLFCSLFRSLFNSYCIFVISVSFLSWLTCKYTPFPNPPPPSLKDSKSKWSELSWTS